MGQVAIWAGTAITNAAVAASSSLSASLPGLMTVAANAAASLAANAVAGCCAPSRAEGGGDWLEEAQ